MDLYNEIQEKCRLLDNSIKISTSNIKTSTTDKANNIEEPIALETSKNTVNIIE